MDALSVPHIALSEDSERLQPRTLTLTLAVATLLVMLPFPLSQPTCVVLILLRAMGVKMSKLSPSRGFSAELATALVITIAAQ